MHSRFRVTNSSDRLGLDLGLPQVIYLPFSGDIFAYYLPIEIIYLSKEIIYLPIKIIYWSR